MQNTHYQEPLVKPGASRNNAPQVRMKNKPNGHSESSRKFDVTESGFGKYAERQ
jgi:hypothetical protein